MIRGLGSTIAQAFRRHPRVFVLSLVILLWVAVRVALPAAAEPTTPTGMGGMTPMPDLAAGGPKSLFEETGNPETWTVDSDVGISDPVAAAANGLVNGLFYLLATTVHETIALAQWILTQADVTPLADAISSAIGGSAKTLMTWLFPTALAIGAVVAFAQRRRGEGINAIVWVLLAATFGVSIAQAPQAWVNATNSARAIGSDTVLSATANAVSPNQDEPITWPKTDFDQTAQTGDNPDVEAASAVKTRRNATVRKTSDALWRGLVVTPWCVTEFGSIEACKRYGAEIIRKGTDAEARKDYINNVVKKQEGGDDAPTTRWTKGKDWSKRFAMVVVALLVALIFEVVLLILGFSAIAAIISTMLHLVVGPFFTMIWCIPGHPRRIGMRWLESLIGTIIQGLLVLLTFGAVLVLITAIFGATASLGLSPALGLALVTVISALKFRQKIAGFFGLTTSGGAGAAILGAMAARGFSRGAAGLTKVANRSNYSLPKFRGRGRTPGADSGAGNPPAPGPADGGPPALPGPTPVRPAPLRPAPAPKNRQLPAGPAGSTKDLSSKPTAVEGSQPGPTPIGSRTAPHAIPASAGGGRSRRPVRAAVTAGTKSSTGKPAAKAAAATAKAPAEPARPTVVSGAVVGGDVGPRPSARAQRMQQDAAGPTPVDYTQVSAPRRRPAAPTAPGRKAATIQTGAGTTPRRAAGSARPAQPAPRTGGIRPSRRSATSRRPMATAQAEPAPQAARRGTARRWRR